MMNREELKAPKALKAWAEREEDGKFWGQPVRIKPAMATTVFGDGGKLAYLTPLNTRPNYFAILVPSWYDEDDLAEHLEPLICSIEEEFGNSDREQDDDESERDTWPCWRDGGCSYGFIRDVPDDLWAATQADLAQQLVDQRALVLGRHRVHPGTLLLHPEFGQVQARHNEELGWHYCRLGVMHEAAPGLLGHSTDFSCVSVALDKGGEPRWNGSYVHVKYSVPKDAPASGQAGKGDGQFPRVLTGEARARAHYALLATLGDRCDAADEEALAYARLDPSLFLERIPASDPFGRGMHNVWEGQSNWYGNWLTKAAGNGFPRTISALLEAGLHPDDPSAFLVKPLLWNAEWHGSPERLAIALQHGASPDSLELTEVPGGSKAAPNRSLVREFLQSISSNAFTTSIQGETVEPHVAVHLGSNIDCVYQLLRAGARKLETIYGEKVSDDGRNLERIGEAHPAVTFVTGRLSALHGNPELQARMLELVRELVASGADISARYQKVAPVIDAVRGKDIVALTTYLSLGASVHDSDIVSTEYPLVGTVLEEAEKTGGFEWRAQVAEAIMVHAMSATPSPAAAAAPTKPKEQRRKMRV